MFGNSLLAQWLGLCASAAGGMGSIPGEGTKIPQAMQHGQKTPKTKKLMFAVFFSFDSRYIKCGPFT